jgi:adenylate kinase
MNLIILGPPGSGKGTLAKLLSAEMGVPHISTGDILREEIHQGSLLGKIAKPFMETGKLVPDEVMLNIMDNRINQPDCRKGFILDGFPRDLVQAERLDQMLSSAKRKIDFALRFVVSEECVLKRLGGRRICSSCGADYNLYSKLPRRKGVCDLCGGELYQREDDKENVVLSRFKVYREKTLPIEEYYNHQGKLIRINSEPDPNMVLKEILKVVQTQ